MRAILMSLCLLLVTTNVVLAQEQNVATLRNAPLAENPKPPRMTPQYNKDLRQVRNYPEQPPLIPHKSNSYQVDKQANQCLSCHSRGAIADSQAPMLSVTHFMDRDGQFLATVSPRRYFCNQCHVSQHEIKPLVGNVFVDIDTLLKKQK